MMTAARDYYEAYWSPTGFRPEGSVSASTDALLRKYVRPSQRCLDFGCGDGRGVGLWLQRYGCRYVGVDISDRALQEARTLGLEVHRIGDAGDLPFADRIFDVVVCFEVLEHLFAPEEALKEIRRLLEPGGLLLCSVPNVAYWRRRVDLALLGRWNPLGDDLAVERPWRDPHIRFFNPGALRRLLHATGFDPVRVRGAGGALLRDLPWVGSRFPGNRPSGLYHALERVMPSLFGYRLFGIARKPPQ